MQRRSYEFKVVVLGFYRHPFIKMAGSGTFCVFSGPRTRILSTRTCIKVFYYESRTVELIVVVLRYDIFIYRVIVLFGEYNSVKSLDTNKNLVE